MLGKLKEKFIKRNVFSELLTQENQFLLWFNIIFLRQVYKFIL